MASSLQEPVSGKSSNMCAAENLFNLQRESFIVGVNPHFLMFWTYLRGCGFDVIAMKKTDPAKYARLRTLFTATQWHDAPEEVAKVIRGEYDVSKEIPSTLLTWLQSDDTSDKARKDFSYYLAYKAACLE